MKWLRDVVLSMNFRIKKQTTNLSNLNYYAKQTRLRIAECDRMLRLKKQKATVAKEEICPKQKATTTTKINKPWTEKKPLCEQWKNIWTDKLSSVLPQAKRKNEYYFATFYENNTLSKEADSKNTERAETLTSISFWRRDLLSFNDKYLRRYGFWNTVSP